jgi:hypothetical protein
MKTVDDARDAADEVRRAAYSAGEVLLAQEFQKLR